MSEKLIEGVVPALATPFTPEGQINPKGTEILIRKVLDAGVSGLYVCGRTGEVESLTMSERKQMVDLSIGIAAHQVPVIAQVGDGSSEGTMNAVELAQYAKAKGADAISSMAPLQSAGDIDIAVAHYTKVGNATDLPFYVYWIANRSAPVTAQKFLDKMQNVPNFKGMKFTDSDLATFQRINKLSGYTLNMLTGPDELFLPGLTMGSDGAIGTTYNFMPETFIGLYTNFYNGNIGGAVDDQARANALIDLLIRDDIGVVGGAKTILNAQGIPVGDPRPPWKTVTLENQQTLMLAMETYRLS